MPECSYSGNASAFILLFFFFKLWYSGGKKVRGGALCVLNTVSVFHFHSVLDYFDAVPLRTRSREGRGEEERGELQWQRERGMVERR